MIYGVMAVHGAMEHDMIERGVMVHGVMVYGVMVHGVMVHGVMVHMRSCLLIFLATYMILQVTVYILLTLCTEILTAVIAEPGRCTVPGYSALPTALATFL